jgi:hypothetical protein
MFYICTAKGRILFSEIAKDSKTFKIIFFAKKIEVELQKLHYDFGF